MLLFDTRGRCVSGVGVGSFKLRRGYDPHMTPVIICIGRSALEGTQSGNREFSVHPQDGPCASRASGQGGGSKGK